MLTNMEKKIAGHLDKKMWMYSGHDKTVASVLKGLGVFQPHSPPYLSTILLELMKRNEEYFVVASI